MSSIGLKICINKNSPGGAVRPGRLWGSQDPDCVGRGEEQGKANQKQWTNHITPNSPDTPDTPDSPVTILTPDRPVTPNTQSPKVAPLVITMNPESSARKEKYITGRCLVINCENAPYQVKGVLFK